VVAVASGCKQLKKLNVRGCGNITDAASTAFAGGLIYYGR